MGKRGPSKKPTEKKRATGNPGGKKLPAEAEVVQLPPAPNRDPLRPLGSAGQAAWLDVWDAAGGWLAQGDRHALQNYCEAVDEHMLLKTQYLETVQADPDNSRAWRMRKQLQDSHHLLRQLGADLGLSPSSRAELGVAEVRMATGMADLMQRNDEPEQPTVLFPK